MHKLFKITVFLLIALTSTAGAVAPDDNIYPLTIMDDMNNSVTIPERPQRILSTMPSNTEILFAVGAGDRIVGGTIHDDYPAEAANITKIGGYTNLDFEKIVDLQPDIIFADEGNGEDAIDMLKELGLNVVVLHPKDIDDILNNIELVGLITGNQKNAMNITKNMRQEMGQIKRKTENIPQEQKPRVLYIVWHEPLYSAGVNTYPDDLIKMAGGTNIQTGENWPIISLEDVIEKDPQIIICSGMGGGSYTIMEAIKSNDVLAQTDALKNDRVYPLDEPSLVERSGPRITDGLTELYSYIEPQILNQTEVKTETGSENNSNQTPGFGSLFALCMILAGYASFKKK